MAEGKKVIEIDMKRWNNNYIIVDMMAVLKQLGLVEYDLRRTGDGRSFYRI